MCSPWGFKTDLKLGPVAFQTEKKFAFSRCGNVRRQIAWTGNMKQRQIGLQWYRDFECIVGVENRAHDFFFVGCQHNKLTFVETVWDRCKNFRSSGSPYRRASSPYSHGAGP